METYWFVGLASAIAIKMIHGYFKTIGSSSLTGFVPCVTLIAASESVIALLCGPKDANSFTFSTLFYLGAL
jgi:hypothetical protein